MKWFNSLKKSVRIALAVAAWIPFVVLLIVTAYTTPEGETMPSWAIPVLIVALALGVFFAVLAFLAYRKEHPKAERPAAAANGKTSDPRIVEDFHSKIVGVTFENDDGSSRQAILSKCKAGDDVIFRPVAVKDHPEALGVFTSDGRQLGHVNSELAAELRKKYPTNPMSVTISEITGGHDGKSLGCNIHIVIYDAPHA